ANMAGVSTATFWWGYEAWRWMFWIELCPAVIFLATLIFIPESPRFLVMKQSNQRALTILQKLYGQESGRRKLHEIEASLVKEDRKPSFSDLIDKTKKRIRPIIWVGIGLATFQQLVG
ncbi:MFS transporter, partial [Alteromonas mediterranea]